MSQHALIFHNRMLDKIKIAEPVVFDGLENFAKSQYEVNNLQQAIGKRSLFIYDFNIALLNRKGRISDRQRKKLAEIENMHGRFNPRAIRIATAELLERLHNRTEAPEKALTLVSDQHFQYRRAVEWDLKELSIEHVTVSSKKHRDYQNLLFPINHADLLVRQRVASFARETISFAKTHGRMSQNYILFAVFKNYLRPQFTKAQIRRHKAHTQSPAQALGLCDRMLTFRDVFSTPVHPLEQRQLNPDWQHFYNREIPPKYQRCRTFCKN